MNLLLTIIVFIGLKIKELYSFLLNALAFIVAIVLLFGSVITVFLLIIASIGMLDAHILQLLPTNSVYGTVYQIHSFSDILLNRAIYIDHGFTYLTFFMVAVLVLMILCLICSVTWDKRRYIKRFIIDNWEEAKRIVSKKSK